MKPSFAKVADRIKGMLHNHPRSQYVRLTRAEAEAVVAAAPLPELGLDRPSEVEWVLRAILRHELAVERDGDGGIPTQVAQYLLTDRYQFQELSRRLGQLDDDLAVIAQWADMARRSLRHRSMLPSVDRASFTQVDQAWASYRVNALWVKATIEAALATHYALDRIKPEQAS